MTYMRELSPCISLLLTLCLAQTRPAVEVKLLTNGDTELGALGTDISQTFLWPHALRPGGAPP